MGAKLKKFMKGLDKIQNQGVVYDEGRSGGSFVYKLDVNLRGKFVVRKYRYWGASVHGNAAKEWEYDNADDAVAKFDEIKNSPWAKWSKNANLIYVN